MDGDTDMTVDPDFQFYAVLAHARTGSNLLSRSLNNHRNVICYSEPFKNEFQIPNTKLYRNHPEIEEIQRRDLVEYLTFLFDNCPKRSATAIGIKEFFYSPKKPSRRTVWDHLWNITGIRFIHVTRRNFFELYLSELYAIKTDKWFDTDGLANDDQDISISPEDCRSFFEKYERHIARTREYIGTKLVLELTYEELTGKYNETLSSVWSFLGVPDMIMAPPLTKQGQRPIREKVENIAELERYFAETRWQGFFA